VLKAGMLLTSVTEVPDFRSSVAWVSFSLRKNLWIAITELSEFSIAKGGAVVDVPDFTRGNWILNK